MRLGCVCPKCNGTTRREVPEDARKWLPNIAGYDKATDSLPCDNCGGQTMNMVASGRVLPNPATGEGCMHVWQGRNAGRCYTIYHCTNNCGTTFDIDSGD